MIRHSLNYNHKEVVNERQTGIDMAVPDQTLSIRELFEKHTRGQLTGDPRQPMYYDDNAYMPDISMMDINELEEYRAYLNEVIEKGLDKQKEDAKKSRTQQLEEEVGRRVAAKLAEAAATGDGKEPSGSTT